MTILLGSILFGVLQKIHECIQTTKKLSFSILFILLQSKYNCNCFIINESKYGYFACAMYYR